jgi:hypothetical protein
MSTTAAPKHLEFFRRHIEGKQLISAMRVCQGFSANAYGQFFIYGFELGNGHHDVVTRKGDTDGHNPEGGPTFHMHIDWELVNWVCLAKFPLHALPEPERWHRISFHQEQGSDMLFGFYSQEPDRFAPDLWPLRDSAPRWHKL